MVRPGGRLESESPRRAGLGAFRFGVGHASEGRALSIDIDPNGFPARKKSSTHFSQSTPTVFHSSFIPFEIICPYIPTKTPSVFRSTRPHHACVCILHTSVSGPKTNTLSLFLHTSLQPPPIRPTVCVHNMQAAAAHPLILSMLTQSKKEGGASCRAFFESFCFVSVLGLAHVQHLVPAFVVFVLSE